MLSDANLEVSQTGGRQGNMGSPGHETNLDQSIMGNLSKKKGQFKNSPGNPFHTGEWICSQPLQHLLREARGGRHGARHLKFLCK